MRLILSSLLLLVHAASTIAAEVPDIVKTCAEQNMPKTTASQAIELTAVDRSGYEQVLQANVYWKRDADNRSRLLMHFEEPADVRNARFLIIENEPQNDMYIYMPGLFKVRKITSKRISSSILGTDFSYEDYERLHGILTDLKAEQYPDDVLTSGYDKIATYIDKQTCVTLKAELFERGHQLRKTLVIDPADIKPVGDIHVPRALVMRDVRDKTETRLVIREIRTGDPLDDALFDPEQLKQQKIPPILAE
jgi:hypothetical protein